MERKKLGTDLSRIQRHSDTKINGLEAKLTKLTETISTQKEEIKALRTEKKALDQKQTRAKESLQSTRKELRSAVVWEATKNGTYTREARELFRCLLQAGCSGARVADAIKACGKTFGVVIKRLPSSRTVFRARDEGGQYGIMQIGREITMCEGFGESSDGTTNRKVNLESRHLHYLAPTYLPGVDDDDKSTWKPQSRFGVVETALNHQAETQFQGTKAFAENVAATYSNSPLARRDGRTMEINDYPRKIEFLGSDHANDAKLKVEKVGDWREDVITSDIGEEVLQLVESGEFVGSFSTLREEDINLAYQQATEEIRPQAGEVQVDKTTARKLVAKVIGQAKLDSMTEAERHLLLGVTFAGCGAHKDMNAFKYGVVKMMAGWAARGQPGPVLLANKANTTTIQLSDDTNTTAAKAAIDSSSRGGVKLTSLAGALFNHSDDKKGYQDKHVNFMGTRKRDLYGIQHGGHFPDTSNTRFQSHSYAAAELVSFIHDYVDLLETTRDSKDSPGFNHMESNIHKGLLDVGTVAEMAAMGLLGDSVSWRFLAIIRGNGKVRNALDPDIAELYRRLPAFCDAIAENPGILLEGEDSPGFDWSKITLDGRPWIDRHLVATIRTLARELPDLLDCISDIFSGAAQGWRVFTSEFTPGGPFDLLTPKQRKRLYIPATNDENEGGLGSIRVWQRYHPNATAFGFSNQKRYERNNTSNFIKKLCTQEDDIYVMRLVRKINSSGENIRFREALVEEMNRKAGEKRKKDEEAAMKRQLELERLTSVGLAMDRDEINNMTVKQLDDQLKIHRKILMDEVLRRVLQKDLPTKVFKLSAVLAAVSRNQP
ncbi:hypothetical protein BDN72DRAFT_926206 [Pluteus cervinus]|uniref:Uncharacterized protein n=1 Tax=Pluteus cervinus TaxID=181527 RepID=A0ACD3AEN5_9AGAR|nr:hypothetical protein BDN72DRAFT_926206 [Pluteus cervinus]